MKCARVFGRREKTNKPEEEHWIKEEQNREKRYGVVSDTDGTCLCDGIPIEGRLVVDHHGQRGGLKDSRERRTFRNVRVGLTLIVTSQVVRLASVGSRLIENESSTGKGATRTMA